MAGGVVGSVGGEVAGPVCAQADETKATMAKNIFICDRILDYMLLSLEQSIYSCSKEVSRKGFFRARTGLSVVAT